MSFISSEDQFLEGTAGIKTARTSFNTHTHIYIGRESGANLHGLLRAIHIVLAWVIASGIYSDHQKTECLNHLMHGTQLILSVLCTKTYLMCSHSYT